MQVRKLSFTAAAQPDGGISPVCGCMFPPVSEWRGVTFAGRAMTIERSGRSPWTEWFVSGAEPDVIRFAMPLRRLSIHVVRLRTDESFSGRWLVDGSLSRHGTVLDSRVMRTYGAGMVDEGTLHAELLGSVPVAAWIPFPGSHVMLGHTESAFPTDPMLPQLTEQYPRTIGPAARTEVAQQQGYPVGDVLGPDVVLWTDDPGARLFGTADAQPAGDGVVTALWVHGGTFSTHVGVAPISEREYRMTVGYYRRHPHAPNSMTFLGRYDAGHVTITVDRPLDQPAFDRVRQRLRHDDLTAVTSYMSIDEFDGRRRTRDAGPVVETERYPPLPANDGFNVFGPLAQATFHDARGSLLVGDRNIDLSAPSDVQLDAVENLKDIDDQQLVTVPLTTARHSADLQFRAVGKVHVNGTTETSFFVRHRDLFTSLLAVATFAGTLLALLSFLRDLARPRPVV